jgi:large subunit ribosomal protein L15
VGRGIGSGTGKTSGRGHKGLGSRAGGGVRVGYLGGQMPVYMQQGKLRGSNRKMSMPMGPFRTHSVPVNVGRLTVFEPGATVDPDALAARGLVKNNANRGWPVKILAGGEIDRPLTVRAHAVSAAARSKIEAAGGTVELIGEGGAAAE